MGKALEYCIHRVEVWFGNVVSFESSRTVCVCGVGAWSRGDRSHRASLVEIGCVGNMASM